MLALIEPSEVTDFVAQLGIVFLLFFLGLEFTLAGSRAAAGTPSWAGGRPRDQRRPRPRRGRVAFGFSFAALILAAAIYVSSSAITVKGLIDFRRLRTTRPTSCSRSSSRRTS